MKKISLIIFSRNDTEDALNLIKDMHDTVDEIVIIDQSDKKKHEMLFKEKKHSHLNKLKIFYCIALGDPAPLRHYGLSKCTGEWVLLLDTDERLSKPLKSDLRKIISNADCDGFAIRRLEHIKNYNNGSTWQIRLYKKAKVEYRGFTHEQALIHGNLCHLQKQDYYIDHFVDYNARPREYGSLEKFWNRLSYNAYNNLMLDFFYKVSLPKGGSDNLSFGAKLLKYTLSAYERLTLKKLDQELSYFDYFIFFWINSVAFNLKFHNFKGMIKAPMHAIRMANKIQTWKNEPDSDKIFRIAQVISEVGVIKYLKLDKEETIKKLINKYKNKEQGINLLIHLLKKRYKEYAKSNKVV